MATRLVTLQEAGTLMHRIFADYRHWIIVCDREGFGLIRSIESTFFPDEESLDDFIIAALNCNDSSFLAMAAIRKSKMSLRQYQKVLRMHGVFQKREDFQRDLLMFTRPENQNRGFIFADLLLPSRMMSE